MKRLVITWVKCSITNTLSSWQVIFFCRINHRPVWLATIVMSLPLEFLMSSKLTIMKYSLRNVTQDILYFLSVSCNIPEHHAASSKQHSARNRQINWLALLFYLGCSTLAFSPDRIHDISMTLCWGIITFLNLLNLLGKNFAHLSECELHYPVFFFFFCRSDSSCELVLSLWDALQIVSSHIISH